MSLTVGQYKGLTDVLTEMNVPFEVSSDNGLQITINDSGGWNHKKIGEINVKQYETTFDCSDPKIQNVLHSYFVRISMD